MSHFNAPSLQKTYLRTPLHLPLLQTILPPRQPPPTRPNCPHRQSRAERSLDVLAHDTARACLRLSTADTSLSANTKAQAGIKRPSTKRTRAVKREPVEASLGGPGMEVGMAQRPGTVNGPLTYFQFFYFCTAPLLNTTAADFETPLTPAPASGDASSGGNVDINVYNGGNGNVHNGGRGESESEFFRCAKGLVGRTREDAGTRRGDVRCAERESRGAGERKSGSARLVCLAGAGEPPICPALPTFPSNTLHQRKRRRHLPPPPSSGSFFHQVCPFHQGTVPFPPTPPTHSPQLLSKRQQLRAVHRQQHSPPTALNGLLRRSLSPTQAGVAYSFQTHSPNAAPPPPTGSEMLGVGCRCMESIRPSTAHGKLATAAAAVDDSSPFSFHPLDRSPGSGSVFSFNVGGGYGYGVAVNPRKRTFGGMNEPCSAHRDDGDQLRAAASLSWSSATMMPALSSAPPPHPSASLQYFEAGLQSASEKGRRRGTGSSRVLSRSSSTTATTASSWSTSPPGSVSTQRARRRRVWEWAQRGRSTRVRRHQAEQLRRALQQAQADVAMRRNIIGMSRIGVSRRSDFKIPLQTVDTKPLNVRREPFVADIGLWSSKSNKEVQTTEAA
ncbi:hypothetical protein B0H14DRAFT_2562451 [Mycena olivaceomarginata]|nr:hypothetical protein B0H14DRAFT_2562451 [Mycena olivaceomarginata]